MSGQREFSLFPGHRHQKITQLLESIEPTPQYYLSIAGGRTDRILPFSRRSEKLQLRPGFELGSSIPFLVTIIITQSVYCTCDRNSFERRHFHFFLNHTSNGFAYSIKPFPVQFEPMDSCLSQKHEQEAKCKTFPPGFELGSPTPFNSRCA